MLTKVVPIVRREEDVGVIQLTSLLKLLNQIPNEVIHSLQSTQMAALKLINVVNDSLVQLRNAQTQIVNPFPNQFSHSKYPNMSLGTIYGAGLTPLTDNTHVLACPYNFPNLTEIYTMDNCNVMHLRMGSAGKRLTKG